jgi:hypothetical protein
MHIEQRHYLLNSGITHTILPEIRTHPMDSHQLFRNIRVRPMACSIGTQIIKYTVTMSRCIPYLLACQKSEEIIFHLLIAKSISAKTIEGNQPAKGYYFNKSPDRICTIIFTYNVSTIDITLVSAYFTIICI